VKDLSYTYGPPELCAYQIEKLGSGNGMFRFETTDRQYARRLSKREDTRRVEANGWNHFRQTYEMRGSWRKAKRIIDRYILSAGDRILGQNSLQNASNLGGRVMTAAPSLSTGDGILGQNTLQDASIGEHSSGNLTSRLKDQERVAA
jgi:hypothetical protein